MRSDLPLRTEGVGAGALDALVPGLVELLKESVDEGASLGFLPPLAREEAREYWESLRGELDAEKRVLIVAMLGEALVGSGQLALPPLPNARHRAEVHKLIVSSAVRSRGVGRALMVALHAEARRRGRTLLILNTRRGEYPELFYRRLGYEEIGVVPGYTVDARGDRHDTMLLYLELPDVGG